MRIEEKYASQSECSSLELFSEIIEKTSKRLIKNNIDDFEEFEDHLHKGIILSVDEFSKLKKLHDKQQTWDYHGPMTVCDSEDHAMTSLNSPGQIKALLVIQMNKSKEFAKLNKNFNSNESI